MEHRQALPTGFLLNEYELLQVLGCGGFGIAYLAYDHELNQKVVIKEYLPSETAVRVSGNTVVAKTMQDEDIFYWGLQRFIDEARALASFRQHPNIVSVLRYFEMHGTAYMVMEFAGAVSLQDYLQQHHVLTEVQFRAMFFPLLDALEAIHASGLIHRDLKPANILINAQGQPVLIDFGAARQSLGHNTTLVTTGYSPFEQYTATGNQGPWTDIYALAAVMYRCVTGEIPPDSLSRMAANTPALKTIPHVPGSYAKVLLDAIDWGLRPEAADRPQSVAAWHKELAKAPVPPKVSMPQMLLNGLGRLSFQGGKLKLGLNGLQIKPVTAALTGIWDKKPYAAIVSTAFLVAATTLFALNEFQDAMDVAHPTVPVPPLSAAAKPTKTKPTADTKILQQLKQISQLMGEINAHETDYQAAKAAMVKIDNILDKYKHSGERFPKKKLEELFAAADEKRQEKSAIIAAQDERVDGYKTSLSDLCSIAGKNHLVAIPGNHYSDGFKQVVLKHANLICQNLELSRANLVADIKSIPATTIPQAFSAS